MGAVLNLYPVLALAAAIGATAVLRDDALEPHAARRTKEIGTDLALLIRGLEDAVDLAREKPVEVLRNDRVSPR